MGENDPKPVKDEEDDEINILAPAEPKEEIRDSPKCEEGDVLITDDMLISEAFGLGEAKKEQRELFNDDINNQKIEENDAGIPEVKGEVGDAMPDDFDYDSEEDRSVVKKKKDKKSKKSRRSKVENEEEAWQDMLLDYDDDDEIIRSIKKVDASNSVVDSKPATKSQIDSITLERSRDLATHCHFYFFENLVKGGFVRAIAKKTKPIVYSLFEVIGCEPTGVDPVNGAALKYQVDTIDTDWLLICKTGNHTRKVRLSHVSNTKATDKEFVEYIKRMDRHNLSVITQKKAIETRKHIWDTYNAFYNEPLTEAKVEKIVLTRQRLRGNASVNLIKNKVIVQNQLEQLSVKRMAAEESGTTIQEGEFEQKCLEMELDETERKLQSVLYGQNSSFGTLAALTLRNAEANKGREEAEDPIDAVVFGRKQGRSGKSYWSVGEGGFGEKKQEIDTFWKKRRQEEHDTKEEADTRRKTERRRGTCPIKDLDSFIADVCASTQGTQIDDSEALLSQESQSQKLSQKPSQQLSQQKSSSPAKAKRRIGLSDFRKKLKSGD